MPSAGILNILKPPGMTSHDVVNFVRRLFNVKKVGHTGTLDPAAAGVLPVCVGRATKIAQYITGADKEYRAEITLGKTTDTLDAEGKVIHVKDASLVNQENFEGVLKEFTGRIKQIPPMASAVKVKGKKLYQLQRQGKKMDIEPRHVTIYKINTVWSAGWGSSHPRIIFDVKCSKGTYIRALCRDIGDKLETGAYMSFLLRTSAGPFTINKAYTLEELQQLPDPAEALISMDAALAEFPEVYVKSRAVKSVLSGAKLYPPGVMRKPEKMEPNQMVRLKDENNLLALAVAVYESEPLKRMVFKPVCILKTIN